MKSEFNPAEHIISNIINELFTLGNNNQDTFISCLRSGSLLASENNQSIVDSLIYKIINYFDYSNNPTEDFLTFTCIDLSDNKNFNEKLIAYQDYDKKSSQILGECPVSESVHNILNAAITLYGLGLKNNADRLSRIGLKQALEDAFKDEISYFNDRKILKSGISQLNKKNASKKRNKYHDISLMIMRKTWDRYPNASINGMNNKILALIQGDDKSNKLVSLSSLDRWRKEEQLAPKKIVSPPISFSLVITNEIQCILDELKRIS